MAEQIISLGMIIILMGFVVLVFGLVSQGKSKQTKIEGGGIVFIGPFPIIGGATNKQIFYILLAASVVLLIVFLVLGRKV